MDVLQPFAVTEGAFATDGGSVWLSVKDGAGDEHSLLLTQHAIPAADASRLRGRVYWDGSLVEVRSESEQKLMDALAGAEREAPPAGPPRKSGPGMIVGDDIKDYYSAVAQGADVALGYLVKSVLDYVRSDEYVAFARAEAERLRQ